MNPPGTVVGVDVGGTWIRAVAVAVNGGPGESGARDVVGQVRVPRPSDADAIVDAVVDCVGRLGGDPVGDLAAVGVGCAGLVDRDGVVHTSPNIAAFVGYPLRDRLVARLAVPVVVDNDANAAAHAELTSGAAVGVDNAVFVAFGTGIGGAFVVDGVIVRGAHGFAGEVGHMRIVPDGPHCVCGRRGCWEQMASGTALERLARRAAAEGRADAIQQAAGGVIDDIRSEHVAALVHDGDPVARGLLNEVARWIAVGVEALVLAVDPRIVVIGGGLSEIGRPFFDAVGREFDAAMIDRDRRPPPDLVAAAHGDVAGALGAALLAGA